MQVNLRWEVAMFILVEACIFKSFVNHTRIAFIASLRIDQRQGSGEGAGPFLRASCLASYAPGPLPLDLDAGRWVHQQLVPVSGPFPTPSSSPLTPPLRAFSPGPAAVPSRRSQSCSPSPKPLGLMTPTSSLCSSSPWLRKLLPALIIPFSFQGLP